MLLTTIVYGSMSSYRLKISVNFSFSKIMFECKVYLLFDKFKIASSLH